MLATWRCGVPEAEILKVHHAWPQLTWRTWIRRLPDANSSQAVQENHTETTVLHCGAKRPSQVLNATTGLRLQLLPLRAISRPLAPTKLLTWPLIHNRQTPMRLANPDVDPTTTSRDPGNRVASPTMRPLSENWTLLCQRSRRPHKHAALYHRNIHHLLWLRSQSVSLGLRFGQLSLQNCNSRTTVERDRLRPISTSASFFFRVWPIRLRPISTSANFWMLNFEGPRRVEAPKGGGPEGWRARRVGADRWGGQNFALFPPSPAKMFFLLSLSLGVFRGILVVFEALGRSNVHVWSSRAVVCEPRRPGLVGPPGFHTTAREPKRAHFRVPAFKNTTKIQRKDPKRGREE